MPKEKRQSIKGEDPKKEDSPTKEEEPPKSPRVNSPKQQQHEEEEGGDEVTKRKRQAEMFKKYLDQTGIAMAFQVIFAEILDKKVEESKLFGYTASRLRQIGEDLEKIKINKK